MGFYADSNQHEQLSHLVENVHLYLPLVVVPGHNKILQNIAIRIQIKCVDSCREMLVSSSSSLFFISSDFKSANAII